QQPERALRRRPRLEQPRERRAGGTVQRRVRPSLPRVRLRAGPGAERGCRGPRAGDCQRVRPPRLRRLRGNPASRSECLRAPPLTDWPGGIDEAPAGKDTDGEHELRVELALLALQPGPLEAAAGPAPRRAGSSALISGGRPPSAPGAPTRAPSGPRAAPTAPW